MLFILSHDLIDAPPPPPSLLTLNTHALTPSASRVNTPHLTSEGGARGVMEDY